MPARLFVFAAVVFFAAGLSAQESPVDSIAAVVNNDAITRSEVRREAAFLIRQARRSAPELAADIGQRQALEVLIERRLQLHEARRFRITVSPAALTARLQETREQIGAANEEAFYAVIRERWGLSAEEYTRRLREDLTIESLFYRRVYLAAEVSRAEVDAFLQQESGLFMGARYRLRHILVAANDDNRRARERHAESLRDDIVDDGDDFAAVAGRESDDKSAADGGDLGFLKETDLPDIFIDAAREMTIGGISEVLESPRGFHLIKLEGRQSGPGEETEQVRISHLFLPDSEAEKARDLRRQMDNGGDFAGLVKEHTIDERSVERGGDLGWFAKDNLPEYFAAPVAKLQEGGISDPVRSPFGWHILLLQKREKRQLDIAALRDRAARLLREERALAKRDEWLQGLRERAYISIRAPELAPEGGAPN
ncbi:MAG: peptidylprolyl isomerase [Gammaproteobacteria bacterium]